LKQVARNRVKLGQIAGQTVKPCVEPTVDSALQL